MPTRPSLSPTTRARIVEMRQQNVSYSAIAKVVRCSKNACVRAMKLFEDTGRYADRQRSGRPRITNAHQERIIKRKVLTDRFVSSRTIATDLLPARVSPRTVRRRLNEFGLFGRVARKKPLISRRNRQVRIRFALDHLNWTQKQWARVLFSDEKKFNRFGNDGTVHVWRKKGESLAPQCLRPTVKGGGGSVMVWGCVSRYGTGPVHRIDGIMDAIGYRNILADVLLPYSEDNLPLNWLFQQDNDPKHTSRLVRQWFADNGVNVIDWPSQSPDLNLIENLWSIVDRAVKKKKSRNLDELFENIAEQWNLIPAAVCAKLFDSMSRRCQAVIDNFGYPTKY